ncbi:MAG TPA: hypothetical protein VHA52_11260 [Candidatus Babeliaceae bacterium]|nr:hypothetical protein [Candidatus Babeliaceae bacterium]
MISRFYIVLLTLLFSGYALAEQQESRCNGKQDCLENSNCLCYCSRICKPRHKESDDRPVYDAQDPHKKYCYCKQWDKDNFIPRKCQLKG